MAAFTDKSILSDTSPLGPALATANGLLCMSWKGDGNNNLSVMTSTDYGRTFSGKLVSTETSTQPPALCEHNGNLYIAWRGQDVENMSVALVDLTGAAISGFSNKVVLSDSSPFRPSLASLNGRLYIGWKRSDNDFLCVMYSSDNGKTFGNGYIWTETSTQAPMLCAHNGSLFIAWKGKDNDNLSVAAVELAGKSITGFSNKVVLSDTSPLSPALASFNGQLYLSWKGDGNDNLSLMSSGDNGKTFENKYVSPETSKDTPTLCSFGRILVIGWTGKDVDNLSVAQATNVILTGTVRPLYQILTLVYAPPGTNGGKSTSAVDYGAGSSAGTTTSTSNSFKQGVSVSASAGGNVGPVNLGASSDFSYSKTQIDSSSVDIKKSTTFDIKFNGPASDGISHDSDAFYLWLNPQLNVTVDPENNLAWELGVDGPAMIVQYVYVAWLKNPASMPAGLKQQLDAAGLTPADYAQILAANPFASGATAIDTNRYLPTTQSFPYNPPLAASDPVPTGTYTQQNTVTTTASHAAQVQYGVSVSVSAGIKAPITASLKVTGSLEWTNTATSSSSSGTSQSASVTVGGPAFGYNGSPDVLVYLDTVYNTFMFAFPPTPPVSVGLITDQLGKPLANKAVTLTTGAKTWSSFTDAHGNYRFYNAPAGPGKIAVGGTSVAVTIGTSAAKTTIKAS